MANLQNFVDGVEKTQFSYPHGTLPPPSLEAMSCTLAGSETADPGDPSEVSDANFESLVVACKDDNPCTVVVNAHTDGPVEASVIAGSAFVAAAVAFAGTPVEKDTHVAVTPWIDPVVGETADLIAETSAGPDAAAAAASFGAFHVEMGIAEAVVVNHVAEPRDQLVLLVQADLDGLVVLQEVQESELASEELQLAKVEKVFRIE